ncbi:hypothetical protein QBC32DRAFT_343390, partial [Pseudoneurospora amorphoporcata]
MIPRFRLALSFFLFCIHFRVFFFVFTFCFVHGLGCCSLACFGIHRHWIIIVTVLHLDFFSELGSHFFTYIPNPPTHQRMFLIFFSCVFSFILRTFVLCPASEPTRGSTDRRVELEL